MKVEELDVGFKPIVITIETEAEFRELWHALNMMPIAIDQYDFEVEFADDNLWMAIDHIARKRKIKFTDKNGGTYDY